ncbi:putative xylogalacturonan beta-1,3-xylosyltransferase [Rosa chinensis]|uniref:Putative xylogalacturonan beta-1,3-xylosyltransferase n=1 Tax=Rosa chinensis TaxID=74649 RepID=A0A2P6Q005_ROSCH|nr:probable glycosyltransferase At5g03795 [Rosa chinensis]XP_024163272.1 probable glycosyltransferase At5g03795 [Rosa chinensis]PRQ27518.1 putative xylogalacturonan beta-1,3-xylosyltransferase [Rosa chinensis]
MGQELLSFCPTEAKRLLWIVGMLFALILVLQHLELPYGSNLSSVLTAGQVPVEKNSSFRARDPSSTVNMVGNESVSNGLDDTATHPFHEIANNNKTSDLVSDGSGGSERTLEIDEDEDESGSLVKENATDITLSEERTEKGSNTTDPGGNENTGFPTTPPPAYPPVNPSLNTSPVVVETDVGAPIISVDSNVPLVEKDQTPSSEKTDKSEQLHSGLNETGKDSSVPRVPVVNKVPEVSTLEVYTISDMNKVLHHSWTSYHSMIPQWSSPADQEMQDAASQIENAPIIKNDPNLYAPLYRNLSMFKRSYELMESTLKVYVYREGQRPIMHTPVLKGIYASEGWFMKQLEDHKRFVTKDPQKAHLYYLPFSSRMLEERLYVQGSHSHKNLIEYLKNYLDMIAGKYPFWNRTGGADHFLVACHDWAPSETKKYMAKCIRALCNADMKEGFVFGKDASLPETYVQNSKNPLRDLGGNRPSKRSILAFFAGSMHGYVRPILLQHWENKDPDMKIFGRLPKSKGNKIYVRHMKSSKYCICAKGYEVNSPRVVEAIFYECVPVIISDNFVPPFFEVLKWESFAVFVLEKDIPNLKDILLSIPKKRYLQMQMRVKRVQQHFLWHARPEKYDIFHMILHSIWYNRLHRI